VSKLTNNKKLRKNFEIRIGGSFELLLQLDFIGTEMEKIYALFKEITNKVTKEVVGFKKSQMEGLDLETEKYMNVGGKPVLKLCMNPLNKTSKTTIALTGKLIEG